MNDWLKTSWDEGRKGDTLKTAALVNRTFTIQSVEPVEFKGTQGEDTWDYIGIITFDGESEPIKAWLNGIGVREQIADMERNRRLPQRVTMALNGKAYELMWPQGTPQTPTSGPESPHSGQRGLGEYLREQGMIGNGALQALGIPVNQGENASIIFKQLVQRTMSEQGCSEDGAYDILLGQLRAGATTGPEAEDIPFEEEIPFE